MNDQLLPHDSECDCQACHFVKTGSSYFVQVSHPTGWVCPKCQKVFAPHVKECLYCGAPTRTVTTTPTLGGCTCGLTSTNLICPVHGGTY